MADSFPRKFGGSRVVYLIIALVILGVIGITLRLKRTDISKFPKDDPAKYQQMVSPFTIASTKLKIGDKSTVDPYKKPTELVPEEPAGWVNLALWYLRSSQPAEAEAALKKAKSLAK